MPFFLDGRARAVDAAGAAIGGSLGLLLGGGAAAPSSTPRSARAVLSPPPGRVAAPVWLSLRGADAAAAATGLGAALRLVSPEGYAAMVDAGRAAVPPSGTRRDPELAGAGAASSGVALARH